LANIDSYGSEIHPHVPQVAIFQHENPLMTQGARLFTLSDRIPTHTDTIQEAIRTGAVNRFDLKSLQPKLSE
jgi:hypothetical protein